MKTILTMTTIPSRLLESETTVLALCEQEFDYLIANIPTVFAKTGELYPKVPEWFYSDERIVVQRCDDVGPSTKIIPTLKWLAEMKIDKGWLIMVDDDIRYPSNFVNNMVEHSALDRVISCSGFCLDDLGKWIHIKNHGEEAHILENFAGGTWRIEQLVGMLAAWQFWSRRFKEDEIHLADDLWMSNYASWLDLKKIVISGLPDFERLDDHKVDALHTNGGNKRRYKRLIKAFHNRNDNYLDRTWSWLK